MYTHGRLTLVIKLKIKCTYIYMYTYGRLTLVNKIKFKCIYIHVHTWPLDFG